MNLNNFSFTVLKMLNELIVRIGVLWWSRAVVECSRLMSKIWYNGGGDGEPVSQDIEL